MLIARVCHKPGCCVNLTVFAKGKTERYCLCFKMWRSFIDSERTQNTHTQKKKKGTLQLVKVGRSSQQQIKFDIWTVQEPVLQPCGKLLLSTSSKL